MSKRNHKITFKRCNTCLSNNFKKIIDLGYHTPADTFLKKKQLSIYIPKIKLNCNICKNCFNIQLSSSIRNFFRYNHVKYSYRSSNSIISRKYWDKFYDYIIKFSELKKGNILEIGANDGYLIKKFSSKKINLYSYEVSREMHNILKQISIKSRNIAFEELSKKDLKDNRRKFDVIICNNVLNHCHKLNVFFNNINKLLSENGKFYMEVPYAPWMIKNNKFELIYLEHINYFSLYNLNQLCIRNELNINRVDFFDYHGEMIRLIITKEISKSSNFAKILNKEKKYFSNLNIFKKFMKNIEKKKYEFKTKIKKIKQEKENLIVGMGAGAKASSFLNYYNLKRGDIDFLTDNSREKIGKYIPIKKIPIKSDNKIKFLKNVYVFFPTWNISTFLEKKIKKINTNVKIIR